jgi:hypothetical protein
LNSGTAGNFTKVAGNGATISGGIAGISCVNKGYQRFSDLVLDDQLNIGVNATGSSDLNFINIVVKSDINPGAYVDAWKIRNCNRIDIDGGATIDVSGGASCDGVEFWGPCNDCTIDNHVVQGFVGAGTHNGFEVYGQAVGDICSNIVFTNCQAISMTNGFSCEGGPNSIEHVDIKAVNCTTTSMADYDAQGIQGATLYVTKDTLTDRFGNVSEL